MKVGILIADKRVRHFWDDAEKIQIVAQTRVPGFSIAKVARRCYVNANLIFKWLRDPRFSPVPVPGVDFPAGDGRGRSSCDEDFELARAGYRREVARFV